MTSNNWKNLNQEITNCRKCARLVRFREKIAHDKTRRFKEWSYWGKPVIGYGNRNAKLIILGLAPAAHGGNRTGRVFTGDKSAGFLFKCLSVVGLSNNSESESRDDGLRIKGYMTVAVKCVPPGDRPTAQERNNCARHLSSEIGRLPNLKIVLGLGKVGFESF